MRTVYREPVPGHRRVYGEAVWAAGRAAGAGGEQMGARGLNGAN